MKGNFESNRVIVQLINVRRDNEKDTMIFLNKKFINGCLVNKQTKNDEHII